MTSDLKLRACTVSDIRAVVAVPQTWRVSPNGRLRVIVDDHGPVHDYPTDYVCGRCAFQTPYWDDMVAHLDSDWPFVGNHRGPSGRDSPQAAPQMAIPDHA